MQLEFPEITQLSHSRIKSWRRCHMQHHYRYYQKLKKKTKARPLWLGTMVHNLIEAHYERGTYEPEALAMTKDFNKLFLEEKEELGDLPVIAQQIVNGYLDFYRDDGLIYLKGRRGRRTEVQLKIDLSNTLRFIGYVDALPQDSEGRVWLMDHKTCASIPDEEARFSDIQMVMYLWLLPMLGYKKPDGIIWDYLRTKLPAIPEKLKNGEFSKAKSIDTTYDVYMNTIRRELGDAKARDYEEFASTLKGREEKFYRRIYLPSPNPHMIELVVQDFLSTANEIQQQGPTSTVRNMTKDCKMCEYYGLCSAEVRGLDTEYIKKTEYSTKEQRDGDTKENHS